MIDEKNREAALREGGRAMYMECHKCAVLNFAMH